MPPGNRAGSACSSPRDPRRGAAQPASRIPEDTIASTVALTFSSVRSIPEFQEFHPIGGVVGSDDGAGPRGAAQPTWVAASRLSATTVDNSGVRTDGFLPSEDRPDPTGRLAYDSCMDGEVTVHMAAPPMKVWELVSDVRNVGEFSPETFEAEWLDGATGPAVGARFRGHVGRNEIGPVYWTTCRVTRKPRGEPLALPVRPRRRRHRRDRVVPP